MVSLVNWNADIPPLTKLLECSNHANAGLMVPTYQLFIHAQCSLPDLNHDHPRPVFAAGPQPRPATPSVHCRTSTTTIHAQCSLPDLNHDHPRPVFAAGPQPRPATPSVCCQTSTTTINAQCSLPDLNSYAKSYAR